jgi:signal transduction histidine kinase
MTLVRRISRDLRPSILDDFGLSAAVEWYAGEFAKRTGIQCRLDVQSDIKISNPEVTTAVYRVFQESLTNVARHSRATEVSVSLSHEDDLMTLVVTDNGRGITPEEQYQTESLGLLGMQERVEYLGGRFRIEGQPGEGTTVKTHFPVGAKGVDR